MNWQRLKSYKDQLLGAGLDEEDADHMADILEDDDEFGADSRSEDDLDHAKHCNRLLQLGDDLDLDDELDDLDDDELEDDDSFEFDDEDED